ncbi:MFS transporter [Streptantibioticus silvisoli]|uniref:MFS transporter n=1 Tax=Streptantibioticus silvisoli TaxID=2705255 RepID=UPI0026E59963
MSSAPGADAAPGSNPSPPTNPPTPPDVPTTAPAGPGATAPDSAPATAPATAPGSAPDSAGTAPATGAPAPGGTPAASPGGRTKRQTFSSLKVRNYRLFATGGVISNTGTWMSRIAQDWLVLSITGSSTAVGVTTALQFLPMLLFGLYGGVIADRYPKRALLMVTQAAMGLLGLALAVLTLSGHVHVWHVYLIAFLLGVVTVVDNPTRQSFVVEMVGPRDVRNAVSLNSANFQTARLVGPAVAGVLITAVGSGWAFLINGLSFTAPLIGLLMMRPAEFHHVERAPRGKGQLREGLHYVAGRPDLIWPIVLIGFIGTFGFNFPIWLSAFAHTVFGSGASTYGLFNTAMAIGSLIGALLAARRVTTRMRMLLGAAMVFGALEMAASLSPSIWLFVGLLVVVGMFGITINTTANSSVQLATDPAMRGRVMSLFMMVFVGGTPLGGPLVGWITDTYGARVGFFLGGLVSGLAALTIALILVRVGGMRLKFAPRTPGRRLTLVPRTGRAPQDAAVPTSGADPVGTAGADGVVTPDDSAALTPEEDPAHGVPAGTAERVRGDGPGTGPRTPVAAV